MTDHLTHIRACYSLADEAVASGNHPFGAILVLDGQVVAAAMNDAVTSGDQTRHAEMVLLVSALPRVPDAARSRAIVYASTEPCLMCAGAIYWSGIGAVVFGCSSAGLATATGGDFLVPCREIFARGVRPVSVTGPLLEEEGIATHRAYWPTLGARR